MESEEGKKATVSQLAKLEEAMKTRDREMEKLDEQVANKKQSGRSQDEEVRVFYHLWWSTMAQFIGPDKEMLFS